MRSQRAAENFLGLGRGFDELREVDSRFDSHLPQHRDQILGCDVAGSSGRHRAAAQLPETRLEGINPLLKGRKDVGETLAPGVVEVGGQLDVAEAFGLESLPDLGIETPDLNRIGHAGRIPETDLDAARASQPQCEFQNPPDRHVSLIGAAEGGRNHSLTAQPGFDRQRDRPFQTGDRFLHGPVDVFHVVGLRSRKKEVGLVEKLAQGKRVLETATVGNQDRIRNPVGPVNPFQHLGCVGQLRDHIGPDEGGHFDPPQARGSQQVDQADFVFGRDHLRFILKTIARSHLADSDRPGKFR